jgi:hypothetical protein
MDIDTTGSNSGSKSDGGTSGHSNSRRIDRLPDAILYDRIITSFLDDRDVAVASACCRAWRTNLPIVRLEPPVEIHHPLTMHGGYHNGDDYFYMLTLPVIISARTRSVTLQGRWRDQGWGNRKGQLAILATSATTTTASASQREPASPVVPPPPRQLSYSDLTEEQENRRMVCLTANVAEHQWHPFTLRFATRTRPGPGSETNYYHLYMKAGSGGGHVLNLAEAKVFTVIMDQPDRSIGRNHRILSDLGVIGGGGGEGAGRGRPRGGGGGGGREQQEEEHSPPFLLQLFQTNIAALRMDHHGGRMGGLTAQQQQQPQPPPPAMPSVPHGNVIVANFLRSHGVNVTSDADLASIQELVALDVARRRGLLLHVPFLFGDDTNNNYDDDDDGDDDDEMDRDRDDNDYDEDD